MAIFVSGLSDARLAAEELGKHPQDHGWRELYRLIALGLRQDVPALVQTLAHMRLAQPASSHVHLVTLLGIAIKRVDPAALAMMAGDTPIEGRLGVLIATLDTYAATMVEICTLRQNSFTGARRFLIPQALLGVYFGGDRGACRFADLGSGLGLLPRQLNVAALYDRWGSDLVWPGGLPAFRTIPLEVRFAVDRAPMPDLEWVRACYGRSEYYDDLFGEILYTQRIEDIDRSAVRHVELDIADRVSLAGFLVGNQINTANLSYVLYEFDEARRGEIVETILDALQPPKVLILTEPNSGLTRQGCTVTLYENGCQHRVCTVSDGHFRGIVTPLDDFGWFTALSVGMR